MSKLLTLAGLLSLTIAFPAEAIILTVDGADGTLARGWQGIDDPSRNPDADDVETITGTTAELTLLYKDDNPGEEGAFAASYSTGYFNTSTDPEDATISYVGGASIVSGEVYALAKDGNSDPRWYVWDISGWDGTEAIEFRDLWLGRGAISHVSIFGGRDGVSVPEPGALTLFGIGLVGIGLARRRKRLAA